MVDHPIERSRGNTPPMLDLETLKSELVIAEQTDDIWPTSSWKSFVLWSLATIGAIILGVVPALWINRWRAEADPAPAAARVEESRPTVEAIEVEADPPPAAAPVETAVAEPAVTPAVAAPKTTVERPARKAKSRAKAERSKASRPTKPRPAAPPCDIYLHPHGCPR